MGDFKELTIIVKWSGKEYAITDLTDQDTVAVLRHEIFKKTQVRPERQKLLNLKYKGKMAEDNLKLCHLELKANFKIMMVGSTESDIEDACYKPEGLSTVVNDLGQIKADYLSYEKYTLYMTKIQKRIREYKINELNHPRPNKNLLVLDIDYTLFDHRSPAESGAELMRPFLHEFLTAAYEYYDIAIWSATSMRWIEEKMRLLGVSNHDRYKIIFYLDCNAMISVYTPTRGVIDVKPLAVIWGIYRQYSQANTIMFDDIRANFVMNPYSGLRIKPYRQAHINRNTDRELLKLSIYLRNMALHCKDFSKLDHRKWEHYDPRK